MFTKECYRLARVETFFTRKDRVIRKIPRSFFIAGTDTDCGKTFVATAMLRKAQILGLSTLGIKPVAAGGFLSEDGLRNEDAVALLKHTTLPVYYDQVNPICLADPTSPHIAAKNAGRKISVSRLSGLCRGALSLRADLTLVEGAGGWRVPLNEREFLPDLVRDLQLPVIVVVGIKLGCINHALLTGEAIVHDGLQIAGWVSTVRDPKMPFQDEYLRTLEEAFPCPCLGKIPYLSPDFQTGTASYDLDEAAKSVHLEPLYL